MINPAVTSTFAERMLDLGGIPTDRVRCAPAPGTATLQDLIRVNEAREGLCELIDGTLVEKAMGWQESILAGVLLRWLGTYIADRNLGLVTGPDGMTRLFADTVRGPDVAFFSWSRLPGGRLPEDPVPDLVPDIAIEILSASKTRAEMARKRREYFQAGVRLVWIVHPRTRTIAIYTSSEQVVVSNECDIIDGGGVLPEWTVDTGLLFGELDRRAPNS